MRFCGLKHQVPLVQRNDGGAAFPFGDQGPVDERLELPSLGQSGSGAGEHPIRQDKEGGPHSSLLPNEEAKLFKPRFLEEDVCSHRGTYLRPQLGRILKVFPEVLQS